MIIANIAWWTLLLLPLYIAYRCDLRELDRQEKKAHQIIRASRKWIEERERRIFLEKVRGEAYATPEKQRAGASAH